jgi:AraC-like DNA-binding protein
LFFSDSPLKAIAKGLGCHCKVLRKRFPELCRLVEDRYKKSFDLVQINQALVNALACSITPPSVKEIAKSLGYPEKVLEYHFPELCSEIFKRRSIKFDTEHLRSALEAVLTNKEEPISMSEVSRRLGYSADVLRKHFPELCAAIAAKYQKFRHQRKQERVQKLCLAAQEATAAIHNQGERPTQTRVGSVMGGTIHFRIPEVRSAWQQKMKELGYEK